MRRRTKAIAIVAGVLLVAVALRLAAPFIVTEYVNRELADMGEYRGTIAGLDLALLRGGYTIHGLEIVKVDGDAETPFVDLEQMDLSLQWRALARGRVAGEVIMHRPNLNFVQSKSEGETQYGSGVNWPEEVRELFPFRLNLVRVIDGLITFRAPGIAVEESLTARNVNAELRNLTNVQRRDTEAFAEFQFDGLVMGNAPLTMSGQIDPNDAAPSFDMNVSLEQAKLVDINPWLREFLKADAHAGVFSLYAELAAANGRFEGYVKPIMENPEFFDPDEAASGPFKKAWEALVGFAAKIFENRAEDQVATQVPLTGELENPQAGLLPAIVNLLRNAFVGAFAHSLEGSISFADVGETATCFATDERRDPEAECD